MKYRKLPVVIEAERWRAGDPFPFPGRANYQTVDGDGQAVFDGLHTTWVKFETGDWIICGVKGEFYPCKPYVFAVTYEEADGD